MWPIGACLSAIIGGFLAVISFRLTIFCTIISFSIALFINFLLVEPSFEKVDEDPQYIKHVKDSIATIKSNRQLLLLMLASFLFYSFGEVDHQLKALFLTFHIIPIQFFGVITSLSFGFSFLGSYFSTSLSDQYGNKNVLLASVIGPFVLTMLATIVRNRILISFFLVSSSFFLGSKVAYY